VDPAWLRAQYERGIVITAVNVPVRDLKALVEDTSGGGAPLPDPAAPFYSMVRTITCRIDQPSAAAGSVALVTTEDLILNIELQISENERACQQASPHE